MTKDIYNISDIIGENLCKLFSQAEEKIVIVAPFIKRKIIEKLIKNVPTIIPIHCVTRWRPDEIALGVSDLDVWPLLQQRGNAKLQICYNLHAKYYRADQRCIVGSANVTAAALGFSTRPNLELVVEVPSQHPVLQAFEYQLSELAVDVTDQIYDDISIIVEQFKKQMLPNLLLPTMDLSTAEANDSETVAQTLIWWPKMRHPSDLYNVYINKVEDLLDDSVRAGRDDLTVLGIPINLTETMFHGYVASLLIQQPLVKHINKYLYQPQRFGAMKEYLRKFFSTLELELKPDATVLWQTLMRWLTYFLPQRYEITVPNHSEIFHLKI